MATLSLNLSDFANHENMPEDDSVLPLQHSKMLNLNSSSPDLRLISKVSNANTQPVKGIADRDEKINPNHFSFVSSVVSGEPQEDQVYAYNLLLQWNAEFVACDTQPLESHSIACQWSGTVWKLRLEPGDEYGQLSAQAPPTATEERLQHCLTLRIIAVELSHLIAVLGHFSVEWNGGRNRIESGGARLARWGRTRSRAESTELSPVERRCCNYECAWSSLPWIWPVCSSR